MLDKSSAWVALAESYVAGPHDLHVTLDDEDGSDESKDVDRYNWINLQKSPCHFANLLELM